MKLDSGRPISRDAWIVATGHHVSARLGGEFAILNLGSGMYHGLEGVGAHVWDMVARPSRVGDIEESLLTEYDVEPEVLRHDLDRLLRQLLDRGLVELHDSRPPASDASE